jgi:glycosyltransferase involved in cell wall biosynthesis
MDEKRTIMKKPILTIAIPTYNGSKTINKLLNSVLIQTFNHDEIEILVSDNCSNDNSVSLINSFRKKYPHINLNLNINLMNLGYDKNIVKLIDSSNGEYIWFIGDDDFLVEDSISSVINKIKASNNTLTYIYTNFYLPKTAKIDSSSIYTNYKNDVYGTDKVLFLKTTKIDYNFISSNIFKKSLINYPNLNLYSSSDWIHVGILIDLFDLNNFTFYCFSKPLIVNFGRRPIEESSANQNGKALTVFNNLVFLVNNKYKNNSLYKSYYSKYLLRYLPSKINNSIRNGYKIRISDIKLISSFFGRNTTYWIVSFPTFFFGRMIHQFLYRLLRSK